MKTILTTMCAAALISAAATLPSTAQTPATPDPDFHIYLCLGQSNMEGSAPIEAVDTTDVPTRFKVMAAADYTSPRRVTGQWYTAVPPLTRQNTGLTLMDYFGRTMIDNLPADVRVGVVPVAVGGCRIENLDKDFDPATLADAADWFKNIMSAYDNIPYQRLVTCAREAMRHGVIKGILLHQGESNNGEQDWPAKVNKVYTDLLADLSLDPASVPLIAGQVVTTEMGGCCGGMNPIIDSLPATIPTAHVVSAAGLPQQGDALHFTSRSYRELGCRYAVAMLATMGIDNPVVNCPPRVEE